MKKSPRPKPPKITIGWRETVSLPDLGLPALPGKIDTGARTTALHASHIRTMKVNGEDWVEFHPEHSGIEESVLCSARIHHVRNITNTSGIPETRIIIATRLVIAGRELPAEISLADRSEMTFPIIIGRTALRTHRLMIDVSRSWVAEPRPSRRSAQVQQEEVS